MDDRKGFISAPLPHYKERVSHGIIPTDKYDTLDLNYHLLNLFCDRSYPMERVLHPQASTPDHTDYHLSWHLWCVLETLLYSHMSEEKLSELHCRYAAQLCQIGLWKYAAFVLMHIQDSDRRCAAVKSLLADHAKELSENEEIVWFLIDQVKIPDVLISEAKCLWCRVSGNTEGEAWLAANASAWNLSHRIFQNKLAPWFVVNGDFDKLKRFLELLGPHSEEIQAWPIGGQIFEDFLLLSETLQAVNRQDAALSELENVKPCLLSLASRLNGMECNQPIQRLAQGEMAKKVCQLLRLVLTKEEQKRIGPVITELSMPDDYMVEELQRLVQLCIDCIDDEE